MSKPWDHLRRQPIHPLPIERAGEFRLHGAAYVGLSFNAHARLNIRSGACEKSAEFTPQALRELAEFCTELADQLESP